MQLHKNKLMQIIKSTFVPLLAERSGLLCPINPCRIPVWLSARGVPMFALVGLVKLLLRPPARMIINLLFWLHIIKKREVRTCYLSHTPGLRTCHPVKISNFEAHADMKTVPSRKKVLDNHIPRTSTVAASATGIPSVRSLECSDEASE